MPLNVKPIVGGGGENVIASYDYYDIAEGTGIKEFITYADIDASGAHKRLGTEVFTSYVNRVSGAYVGCVSGAYTKIMDLDFSLSPFNYPKIIDGTAQVECHSYVHQASPATCSGVYVVAGIKKNDDIVASMADKHIAYPANEYRTFLAVDIPRTNYRKGDILKLNIRSYADVKLSGALLQGVLLSDPSGSSAHVYIPFKIDLG